MNTTDAATAPTPETTTVQLRPLERGDLHFVHELNNNRTVMSYWFEEPYESFVELEELFRKHIHEGPAHPVRTCPVGASGV
ncbi:hypothetical protein [Luteimonas terrae]|uniref:hypothetical protein n=1 Tax=Luteimonas terrae TaxID=1530191 RepID=UPI001FB6132F|nr:hypothetical protein [Luteimonas terrae]